mgnify:CR=1 FL=1
MNYSIYLHTMMYNILIFPPLSFSVFLVSSLNRFLTQLQKSRLLDPPKVSYFLHPSTNKVSTLHTTLSSLYPVPLVVGQGRGVNFISSNERKNEEQFAENRIEHIIVHHGNKGRNSSTI